nr:anti-phage dCTP deaminase [Thiocapsa sp. KS1]
MAGKLSVLLEQLGRTPSTIKARNALDLYATVKGVPLPKDADTAVEKVILYQDLGDSLRRDSEENSAVAAYMVRKIRESRTSRAGGSSVFILDSLKHPAEVYLLRSVYGENFCLIGVGCRPDVRLTRLKRKLHLDHERDGPTLDSLMGRDAEDSEKKYGQHVDDTFHLSDFFVDNTVVDEDSRGYHLPDKLARLTDLLFAGKIDRPEKDERGLYYAHAASLRSSCLSRQVGAAILDDDGNLVAVGCNDVPRPTGGLYGPEDAQHDDRCFRERKVCSNTVEQRAVAKDLFERLEKSGFIPHDKSLEDFRRAIKGSRISALIEFSRSVHAEMDALVSCIRKGNALTAGAVLYSTTYPCHNCARHIVAAGIMRVVYLEPYAKSKAIDLHNDSIADNLPEAEANGKVAFAPYQGVSPRLFKRIFLKTGDLKNKETGELLGPKDIDGFRGALLSKSYLELENDVAKFLDDFENVNRNDEDQPA